ncbi:MAG TPA: LysR family transcriptional regulator [Bdellovibrionota bacterium]|nr:LysR family transcriptional regulator [Bdellovibrionota bacterium]
MLKINFHHLYYFYSIAEERQIARAARRLRLGQPTLSTQLKQFEEFLGYRLFDRKRGQALTLTPRGEILYRYASEIFRLSDEMLAAAQGLKSEGSLQLRLGALDWLPKQEVSELIAVITSEFDCFVSVHEDTAENLLARLAAHEFDLIITNSPASEDPLRTHRIAVLPILIYGAPRFRGLKDGFPESLENEPIILPTRHGRTRQVIDDYFESRGIRLKVVGEAQDGELLRRAALRGTALVPLSPSTIDAEINRGDLVAIGELAQAYEEVWIISTPRLVNHPVVSFLMHDLRKAA